MCKIIVNFVHLSIKVTLHKKSQKVKIIKMIFQEKYVLFSYRNFSGKYTCLSTFSKKNKNIFVSFFDVFYFLVFVGFLRFFGLFSKLKGYY